MPLKLITKTQLLDYFIHHAAIHDTGNDKRPFLVCYKIGSTEFMAEAGTPWDAYDSLVSSVFDAHPFSRGYLIGELTRAYHAAIHSLPT
jgi:hypothetical protein